MSASELDVVEIMQRSAPTLGESERLRSNGAAGVRIVAVEHAVDALLPPLVARGRAPERATAWGVAPHVLVRRGGSRAEDREQLLHALLAGLALRPYELAAGVHDGDRVVGRSADGESDQVCSVDAVDG